jgi:hypothetical protein
MPTTTGRWLSLLSIPAAVLLVLAWLIPVSFLLPYMSASDVRAVAEPTGNLALLNHWLTLGLAVLICMAFPVIAQAARGRWPVAIGATLYTLALFLIGVENLFAIVAPSTPVPWHPLLAATLSAIGSVLFGVGAYRAGVLPRGATVLFAFIQPTGLFGVAGPFATTLLFGTDFGLASSTLLRMYGYLAMWGVAIAWAWLGYAAWRRPAHAAGSYTATASPPSTRPELRVP